MDVGVGWGVPGSITRETEMENVNQAYLSEQEND